MDSVGFPVLTRAAPDGQTVRVALKDAVLVELVHARWRCYIALENGIHVQHVDVVARYFALTVLLLLQIIVVCASWLLVAWPLKLVIRLLHELAPKSIPVRSLWNEARTRAGDIESADVGGGHEEKHNKIDGNDCGRGARPRCDIRIWSRVQKVVYCVLSAKIRRRA